MLKASTTHSSNHSLKAQETVWETYSTRGWHCFCYSEYVQLLWTCSRFHDILSTILRLRLCRLIMLWMSISWKFTQGKNLSIIFLMAQNNYTDYTSLELSSDYSQFSTHGNLILLLFLYMFIWDKILPRHELQRRTTKQCAFVHLNTWSRNPRWVLNWIPEDENGTLDETHAKQKNWNRCYWMDNMI